MRFDRRRLRASLERARAAAGEGDSALVDEVADIVTFTLTSEVGAAGAVGADEVGWSAERTLVELGHARVAREFILARDRRTRARGVAVPGRVGAAGEAHGRLPRVRGRDGVRDFDPSRVAAALIEEAGLAEEVAAAVAQRVEGFLRGASLATVTSALVRELVSHALLDAGLADALRRHEAVGLPRHDLRRLFVGGAGPRFGPGAASGWEVGEARREVVTRTGAAVLERWVLEDSLPHEAAEAHRRADLHVVGAERPHESLSRSLGADLLADAGVGGSAATGRGAEGGWSRSDAFSLVRRCGLAMVDAARGLFLEDVAGCVAGAMEPGGASFDRREAPVVDLLMALGAAAETAGRDLGLVRFGGKRGVAAGRLLRSLQRAVAAGGAAVRLHATLAEVEDALSAVPDGEMRARTLAAAEELLASGHLVPVWAPEGRRWVGPGCLRGRRERGVLAVGSAVAINLPRLARRAGPWREDRFLQLLVDQLGTAVEATRAMADLQRGSQRGPQRGTRRSEPGLRAARTVHLLVPVGLQEALRILGDGVARPEQGALALGLAREAAARSGATAELRVEVSDFFQAPAAARFAAADGVAGASQGRLFGDLPTPELDTPGAYGGALPGLDVDPSTDAGALGERARAAATLLGTTAAGALLPDRRDGSPLEGADFGGVGARVGDESDRLETPRFDLWRRIWAQRGSGGLGPSPEAEKSLF